MIPLVVLVAAAGGLEVAPAPRPAGVVVTPEVAAKLREIAFQAARDGDVETLAAYLKAGRPVNEPNARGDTLLTVAAYHGQQAAVEVILARPKVEVDARNGMGLTALAAAAFKGHTGIGKALMAKGADVNAANGRGQTALMFAALTGRTEMVRYLLSAGADPKAKDKAGNSPLSLAEAQGASDAAELLRAARK